MREPKPNHYTFGDNKRASTRLQRLAKLYEPETRALLERSIILNPSLAVDLGCGPGWSTQVLQETLMPGRTVGLDSSSRLIAEARAREATQIEFEVHDVTCSPFPVSAPDVMLCRFLLTHLQRPKEVLALWAEIARPGGYLLIHETETLETEQPTLRRYYELVDQLQRHHGQTLYVGAVLEELFVGTPWHLMESHRCVLHKFQSQMAGLHLSNLRTWREDEYAHEAFDQDEINRLENSLQEIADKADDRTVVNVARQVIAGRQ